jgi:hypothetical protein
MGDISPSSRRRELRKMKQIGRNIPEPEAKRQPKERRLGRRSGSWGAHKQREEEPAA